MLEKIFLPNKSYISTLSINSFFEEIILIISFAGFGYILMLFEELISKSLLSSVILKIEENYSVPDSSFQALKINTSLKA